MSNNIQMDIVALATRAEDFVQQKLNMVNIDTTYCRKLLLIFIIGFLALTTYLRFAPTIVNIPREKISVVEKPRPPSIGGFYHFATVGDHWKSVINEQMLLAHISGLIDASLNVYVTGLGKIDENKTIYDIFAKPKFVYEYDTKLEVYEFPALRKVEKFCLDHNDSLVWYAHSKGVTHPGDRMARWRGLMNHFVLDRWQLCYGLLSTTNYTTCGSVLTFDSVRQAGWNTYYSGNMWWAKCSQVNRLTRIEKLDQKDRYIAELYVTSEPDIGHFNCFSTNPHSPFELNKQTASCTENQPMWKVR